MEILTQTSLIILQLALLYSISASQPALAQKSQSTQVDVNSIENTLPLDNQKKELEIEKLKQELKVMSRDSELQDLRIRKLQREIDTLWMRPFLDVFPIVIAFAAAIVSLWSAYQSQQSSREQNEQTNQDRIANLLEELGHENNGVRIAAIQILSKFPDTYNFLINLLKYETDQHVLDSINASISKCPKKALALLLQETKSIRQQIYSCITLLEVFQETREEISKLFKFHRVELDQWLDSIDGKHSKSYFEAKINFLQNSAQSEKESALKRASMLLTARKNILNAIEKMIELVEDEFCVRDAYLPNIFLNGLDISNWSFINCDLRNSSFCDSVCKKTIFTNSILDNARFDSASLHDAVFNDQTSCYKTSFKNARLIRCSFQSCDAKYAIFTSAKIKEAKFCGDNVNEKSDFTKAKFISSIGEEPEFRNIKLLGADFSGGRTIINKAKFENVELDGAKLVSLKARYSEFKDSSFSGNDLQETDFEEAKFSNVSFRKITHFNNSNFSNATLTGENFDESENFCQYIAEFKKK